MKEFEMTNISVNVKDAKLAELDQFGACIDRDRSWVVNEALDQYLARQRGILEMIDKAVVASKANCGHGKPHEEVAEAARRLLKEELRK